MLIFLRAGRDRRCVNVMDVVLTLPSPSTKRLARHMPAFIHHIATETPEFIYSNEFARERMKGPILR